jgi:DNA-binding NarL/FixJ family response regulator
MNDFTKIRILVMHGENLIDAGLVATLSRHADIEILEPCTARDPQAVLQGLPGQRADILITDYERGVWLAAALHEEQVPFRPVRPRLILVTSRATQNEIRTALKQGVAGYLTASSPADEVLEAVRKVQMGMRHVSEPLAGKLLDDLLGEQLTPRESQVLRLAAEGLANKVIAARLRVELGTVKCHMRAVLDKLRAGNRTEAVVIAQQRGLLALVRPSSSATGAPASRRQSSAPSGRKRVDVAWAQQPRASATQAVA